MQVSIGQSDIPEGTPIKIVTMSDVKPQMAEWRMTRKYTLQINAIRNHIG
ncbi:hypothetical protein LMG26840_04616 [Achromobacter dolens]|nr:hypothetical protein LMG26840_04616 [Achromobacter dolens]